MKLGTEGESQAAEYLKKQGYIILEQNYRAGRNEVDIICEKKGIVVFVEVKTRTTDNFGEPVEAVDSTKTRKIIKVAQSYLHNRDLWDKCKVRFDVIGINKDGINHIEDAFR